MTATGREGESLKGRAAFSPGGEYDPDRRAEPIQRPDGQGLRTRAARRSGSPAAPNTWRLGDLALVGKPRLQARIVAFHPTVVEVEYIEGATLPGSHLPLIGTRRRWPYGALREE